MAETQTIDKDKTPPVPEGAKKKPKQESDYEDFFNDEYEKIDGYEIRLYRVVLNKTRIRKSFLKTYNGTIPPREEIGENFGGGEFLATSRHPESGASLFKTIYMDEAYWDPIYQAKQIAILETKKQELQAQHIPQESGVPGLAGLRDLVEAIKPLMNNQPPQPAPPPPEMQTKAVSAMFDTMLGGMKKMQMALIDKSINDIQPEKKTPEEEQKGFSLAREVIDFIKEEGPKYLQANPITQRMYKAAVHDDPRVQEVTQDPALFQQIYEAVCQPDSLGKEKANQLFQGLGFTLPEQSE